MTILKVEFEDTNTRKTIDQRTVDVPDYGMSFVIDLPAVADASDTHRYRLTIHDVSKPEDRSVLDGTRFMDLFDFLYDITQQSGVSLGSMKELLHRIVEHLREHPDSPIANILWELIELKKVSVE